MRTRRSGASSRDDANFVEQLQADPAVAKHFKKGELERSRRSLDFHFKEVNSRCKKLDL